MLGSFKHKGLQKLFESGNTAGVDTLHVDRLRKILALLATAESIEDMSLPGLNLHELKGARKGTRSVKVSGNWRITFRFEKGDVIDVDYEDYH
jgi:proteic killer suppression protein